MDNKTSVQLSITKILSLFQEDTDRGAALIAAALIESQLEDLIMEFSSHGNRDNILGHQGLLDSLSKKSKFCYYFNLIDKQSYDCINLLRQIRNAFAHQFIDIDFETNDGKLAIRNWIESFGYNNEVVSNMIGVNSRGKKSTARVKFEIAITMLTFYIDMLIQRVNKPEKMTYTMTDMQKELLDRALREEKAHVLNAFIKST